jgi:hypothetical protein|eukprot:COSAG06_NODE_4898_length_3874_cov_26.346755_2_plen_186_part_00
MQCQHCVLRGAFLTLSCCSSCCSCPSSAHTDTTWSYKYVSGPPESSRISLDAVRDFLDGGSAPLSEVSRQFPSHRAVEAIGPVVSYTINVTNTGSMDADHVVLGMLTPPQAGTGGVPLQTLWGFERVFVPAGKTVSVTMYPALTEFTQVDASGLRNVHTGVYTFSFGLKEMPENQGFLQRAVEAY